MDKVRKNFWNIIHDTKKVSINILSDKNVASYESNGYLVLIINVSIACI